MIGDTFGVAVSCADDLFNYSHNDGLEWIQNVGEPLEKMEAELKEEEEKLKTTRPVNHL